MEELCCELILLYLDESTKISLIYACKLFKKRFFKPSPFYGHVCAEEGNYNLLHWSLQYGYEFDNDLCVISAEKANIEEFGPLFKMMIFYNDIDTNWWIEKICESALKGENKNILIWLNEKTPSSITIIRFLKLFPNSPQNLTKTVDDFYREAIKRNCVDDIECLLESTKIKPSMSILYGTAISNNCIEVLKWALKRKFYWNDEILTSASAHGNIEIFKLFIEDESFKTILKDNIFYMCARRAASCGNLNILKWMKENCQLFPYQRDFKGLFCYAFSGKAMEVCEWLKQEGYVPDRYDINQIFILGDVTLLNYAYETFNFELTQQLADYASNIKMIKWFKKRGFHPNIFRICTQGGIDDIRWAIKHHIEPNNKTIDFLTEMGDLKKIKWLYKMGLKSDKTLDIAIERHKFEIVLWLYEKGQRPSLEQYKKSHDVVQNWLEDLDDYSGDIMDYQIDNFCQFLDKTA